MWRTRSKPTHEPPNAGYPLLIDALHDHTHNSSYANSLIGLGNATLIARAIVVVTTDLLILALALLHECSQLSIVVLSDSPGSHLDLAVTARFCDVLLDVNNSLFEACDTGVLVQALRGEDYRRQQ